jgi:glyceraldehyde 3-phosphate dehydrogenase
MIPTSTGAATAVGLVLPQLKGILGVTDEPLVSIDFNHNPASSTFDLTGTQIVDGKLVRVLAWYDNEWGFSNRMADTAVAMGKLL